MWKYEQSTGNLSDPSGAVIGTGYSGHGEGVNNPAMQNVADIGPIPQGLWIIGPFFDDPGGKGPIVTPLTPEEVTKTFGRDGFMIHGDTKEANHTASHGCIILNRTIRLAIKESPDKELLVV